MSTCMSACMLSHFSLVQYFTTLQTIALQAPTSMGFSRLEFWCGLSFPSPGDFPNVAIQPASLASWVLKSRWSPFLVWSEHCMGFPSGICGKEPVCQCRRWDVGGVGLIYVLGRFPEGGHGNPLQYSCLENSMDRGAWWATQSMRSQRVGFDWSDLVCTHEHSSVKSNWTQKKSFWPFKKLLGLYLFG